MTHSETLKKSTDTNMEQKENLLDKDLTLGVVLPGEVEKTDTVHGSKPVMDLLVTLCAKYRLSPSSHTIELVSTNGDHIKFNPNALIGAMEVEKILIKPKGMADKSKKQSPQMPEATVRLVINYKKTHKTVLRVSPRVPLKELIPAICGKCELDQNTTVLLSGSCSEEPLDLAQSLNDFGLREVFAMDKKGVNSANLLASPRHGVEDKSLPSKAKVLKEKENKGLFSIFRRSKKKPDQAVSASAPASPGLIKDKASSMTCLSANASTCSSNVMLSYVPKKRRAPLPPMMSSQSVPSNLSDIQANSKPDGAQEESQKRSKRRAPPSPLPPRMSTPEESAQDKGIKVVTLGNLAEISEQEELVYTVEPDLSTRRENNNSLNLSTDASVDCGRTELVSPPTDVEMQDASLSQGLVEEQLSDLSSDGKPVMDRNYKKDCAEEPCTHEMENIVSVDCDASPAEERTGEPHPSGGNAKAEGEDSQECSPGMGTDSHSAPGSPVPLIPNFQPVTLEAGTQASSDQVNSKGVCGEVSEKEAPPVEDNSCITSPGGDNLIGTGDRACPVASPQQDPHHGESPPAFAEEPRAPHIKDTEPKTKLSSELTRQYLPRAGLTTYTIVPSKSVEKLKYFEVELTLEDPAVALKEKEAVGSTEPGDCDATTDQSENQPELFIIEGHELTSGTVTIDNADHDHMAPALSAPAPVVPQADRENSSLSFLDDSHTQAGQAQEFKGKKIPPVIKPKPDAVHVAQHKRATGVYVISAAMKNVSTISESGQKEESVGIEEEGRFPTPSPSPPPYPPPPPPVEREQEATQGPQKEEEEEENSIPPSLPSPPPYPPLPPPSQREQEATEGPQEEEDSVPPSLPSPPPYPPLPPPSQREQEATEGPQEEEEEGDSVPPSLPSPHPYPPLPTPSQRERPQEEEEKEDTIPPAAPSPPSYSPPVQREQEAREEPQEKDHFSPQIPSPPPYPPLPTPSQREQEAREGPQEEEEEEDTIPPAAPSPPSYSPPVQREQEAREEPQEKDRLSPQIPSPHPYPPLPTPSQREQEAREGPQEEEDEEDTIPPAAPSPPSYSPPVQREQEAREEPQEKDRFSPQIPCPLPYPPPPPPPVQRQQEAREEPREEEELKSSEISVPDDVITRCTAKERPVELSLEKLTSFAAPKPYVPAGPSRFSLAVSSAVKRSQHLTPQSGLHAEAGSKMLEGEAQERQDDRAWAFRVEVDPGCDSDSTVPARGSGLNGLGEARTTSRDDAEPRMDEVIDSLAVPDTLSPTSLSGSTGTEPTQEEERYLSPSCHMTPLDPHGRN
ncbi:hypothetical protein AAFF_G00045250 [Aldrovandia affinis]|uniref:Cordon-bleu ubiquitin-like domain-containing protein n=1 Tax=Aldrovandia affinis TaxID=143900 RepID=A0AAD7WFC1_9TELE|nr:hypothetical protein AAFF_G00045250 [Aldrovandia affinis]